MMAGLSTESSEQAASAERACSRNSSVDAHQGRRHQAEDRKGAVAAAHRGLAGEDLQPAFALGLLFEGAARVGDGDQVLDDFLFGQGLGQFGAHRAQVAHGLDRAAALRRRDHDELMRVARVEQGAKTHRRVGVERAELHFRTVDAVVLGDGHGRLGGAAFAQKEHLVEAGVLGLLCKGLDVVDRVRRVARQIDPSHEVARTGFGCFVEAVERGVFRVQTTGPWSFTRVFADG